MKTTTEPPIEKFTVNGLEFNRTFDDMSPHWHAATDAGECIQLLKRSDMTWAWKCARSEWQDISTGAGFHASDAPAMAAIALTDAARYFRALADSFGVPEDAAVEIECLQRELDLKTHVLDQYEKEALITLAELEKVTRDAADFAMMIKRLCAALDSLTAPMWPHRLKADAEDLIKRKGYHNILREEGGAQP